MRQPKWLTVTVRVFMDLKNDRRTVALIFLAPVLVMLLFGFAFSGEVHDVDVCVVDLDAGARGPGGATVKVSDKVIDNLDEDTISVERMDDAAAAKKRVEGGDAWGAIVFPRDFSQAVVTIRSGSGAAGAADIELYLDESNVNVAQAITKALNDALRATMEQTGVTMPVSVDVSAVHGEGAKYIDFFVPGIMCFAVFMLTSMLTLISFVGERTSGTLERLLSTPLREWQIVAGYATAFGLIGMFQSLILLLIGMIVFDIMIVGNVFLAFCITALLAVGAQGLGILLSSLARRESQVIQFLPLIIIPSLLLSGVIWPLEAIPSWLRPVSYVIPVTYGVDAMRSIMIRGWGLADVWLDAFVLVTFAAVFPVLASLSLKLNRN